MCFFLSTIGITFGTQLRKLMSKHVERHSVFSMKTFCDYIRVAVVKHYLIFNLQLLYIVLRLT